VKLGFGGISESWTPIDAQKSLISDERDSLEAQMVRHLLVRRLLFRRLSQIDAISSVSSGPVVGLDLLGGADGQFGETGIGCHPGLPILGGLPNRSRTEKALP